MVTPGLKTVFEPRGVEVGAEGAGAPYTFPEKGARTQRRQVDCCKGQG